MINSKYFIFIVAFVFLMTSCEKIELGEEVSVKIGEKYKVSWNLTFKIDSISDYRCPVDLICIWAGDVDLYFDLGREKEVTNLYNRDTNPFRYNGYTIEIIDVLPERRSTVEVNPEDYAIKIKVLR